MGGGGCSLSLARRSPSFGCLQDAWDYVHNSFGLLRSPWNADSTPFVTRHNMTNADVSIQSIQS